MPDELRPVNPIDQFISGLTVIRSLVIGSSFYNSSCGASYYKLSRKLTQTERDFLVSIDWVIGMNEDSVEFGEWGF